MKARTIVTLESEQLLLLKQLALFDQNSLSSLIRQAVDLLLEKKKLNSAQLILKSAQKVAKSYPPAFKKAADLSKNIDKIVYG